MSISIPMPGIVPFPNITNTVSEYDHWLCGTMTIINTNELTQYVDRTDGAGSATGICQAGSGYIRGFSFLLTFVVCVVQLAFVLVMYALWIDVHWTQAGRRNDSGQFKDAVTMVVQAQRQHGPNIDEWSAKTLQEEIVSGKFGMSFVEDVENLRKRRSAAQSEQEFGDPNSGDWGSDIVVDSHR